MCICFNFDEIFVMETVSNKSMRPEHKKFLGRIGETIKALRKDKRIKIKELVLETQINRNAYRQLEKGDTYFKISSLIKILDFYKVDYYDFLKKIGEENTSVGAKKPK